MIRREHDPHAGILVHTGEVGEFVFEVPDAMDRPRLDVQFDTSGSWSEVESMEPRRGAAIRIPVRGDCRARFRWVGR